jgi:hypothetical protein
VLFCTLGKEHGGLHLHGTREWSGDDEAPIATALRALRRTVAAPNEDGLGE